MYLVHFGFFVLIYASFSHSSLYKRSNSIIPSLEYKLFDPSLQKMPALKDFVQLSTQYSLMSGTKKFLTSKAQKIYKEMFFSLIMKLIIPDQHTSFIDNTQNMEVIAIGKSSKRSYPISMPITKQQINPSAAFIKWIDRLYQSESAFFITIITSYEWIWSFYLDRPHPISMQQYHHAFDHSRPNLKELSKYHRPMLVSLLAQEGINQIERDLNPRIVQATKSVNGGKLIRHLAEHTNGKKSLGNSSFSGRELKAVKHDLTNVLKNLKSQGEDVNLKSIQKAKGLKILDISLDLIRSDDLQKLKHRLKAAHYIKLTDGREGVIITTPWGQGLMKNIDKGQKVRVLIINEKLIKNPERMFKISDPENPLYY